MIDPETIKPYSSEMGYYAPGDVVMGTDGNLWKLGTLGGDSYWQRMPVLNVDTMTLEHKA